MYAYNAEPADLEFSKIPAVPSVVGYALLQGPRVPRSGSTAFWNGGTVDGYANLPASSFTYTDGDTRIGDSRLRTNAGTVTMWYVMRGFQGVFTNPPACLVDPVTGACTTFELTGDAENFAGWVDGSVTAKGDRRLVLSSGPFSLARGDAGSGVRACRRGGGRQSRAGISRLARISAPPGSLPDQFYCSCNHPASDTRTVELDGKVILDWESDRAAMEAVESYDSRGFRFENYELFQLPHADSPWRRVSDFVHSTS